MSSGFLANRFGRKRILMVAVVGFVVASVLCGIAQSLVQIVAFRLLQGFFGAALVPLGQSVLLDIYTAEERGSAMALFGVSVMVGPVLGPVIGGWLTDHYSWRWVFYINVPLGVLAFAGISFFLGETKTSAAAKLDWLGFGSLSLAIAALQVFLDRGAQLDWFSSFEILIEAVVCASALYIFLVHTFTAKNSFVNPRLFLDRNFSVGVLFIFIVGITYLASLALLTPYLQTLRRSSSSMDGHRTIFAGANSTRASLRTNSTSWLSIFAATACRKHPRRRKTIRNPSFGRMTLPPSSISSA
jgi:MFS transporter, DHA2 family, multidrug resistance protein